MKLLKWTLLGAIFLISTAFSKAQIALKTGGKNEIHLTGLMNVPLLSGAFNQENYFERNGEIISRKDFIDYGANFRYSFKASKRIRLGLDLTVRQLEVFTDRKYESGYSSAQLGAFKRTTNYRVESIAVPHWTLQPVVIFSSPSSINGSGFENIFGLGLSTYSPTRKSYAYSLTDFPSDEGNWTEADFYYLDHDWPRTYALTFQYGLSLSVPITKTFLFKIGTTCLLNIYFKPDFEEFETVEIGLFNAENVFYNVQRENFISWNIQTGIACRF